MARWREYVAPLGKHGWTASRQLALQMPPLTRKLTRTDRDWLNSPDWADLGAIEGVATVYCLGMDRCEIRVYGRARLGMRLEALQLRMACIASRLAAEHCFGQKRLAPKSNKTLRV